jgi:SpoU rRNA methylase family enzyme
MKFFYENSLGDSGYFSEKDLVKAIYTAWNIEADLYLLNNNIKKLDPNESISKQAILVFSSVEGNEFNSDILKEFGYRMEDGEKYREIIEISTGNIVKYDWSEVRQLI